jgi:hypothetical protein
MCAWEKGEVMDLEIVLKNTKAWGGRWLTSPYWRVQRSFSNILIKDLDCRFCLG